MNLYGYLVIWIFMFLYLAIIEGNHFHWWNCSAQCQKCIRKATPLDKWISEYYSGLFSHEVNQGGNPGTIFGGIIYPDKAGNEQQNYSSVGSGGCCQTYHGYFAPELANVSGKIYKVVHLQNGNQFIPIGRCRNGTTCPHGVCEEIRRYHWTLVYNDVKNATTPVTFVKVGVASHCECVNIGRAKP